MKTKENRKHKRYETIEKIKGIVFPIGQENITTEMVDVCVVNYSDGGVLVKVAKGKFRPVIEQDVYFLLTLDEESIFTLKGKIIRVENSKQFAIQFNEAIDHIGTFPHEDILQMKERLLQKLRVVFS